ncbi:dienelactone hydrolase family protein [Streptomyces marokkonensis]|uniref:Dienelactone hydrolase family protein n=1 Tax=Streptomyces marokkonensis TaxID=324855 RepID=A0ABW6QEL5_9ACTN
MPTPAGFHGAGRRRAPRAARTGGRRITAEVYFGRAGRDRSLPPERIGRLERALTDAGARQRCESYTGAGH